MSDPRRRFPAMHALKADARRAGLGADGDPELADAVRDVLAAARAEARAPDDWLAAVAAALDARHSRTIRRVINATGVVLHTNLGRAPLAETARRAMVEAAGYTALELDLETGARGDRQDHTARLLVELTGGEAALAVNNAASALMLALAALARGGETLVARGELVEIGGGFRLPEVMAQSGTVLVEVGTTNRTRLADYTAALSARTRAVLRMHRSNFQITGFTTEPSLQHLAGLARPRALAFIHDIGSGLLMDLSPWGLSGEPLVQESVRAGALTIFSGDKLLGGPQAGLLVGPARWMDRLAAHPMSRALRPEKTVLAGLEATLRLYRDGRSAREAIPVLAMLTADARTLRRRARRLARRVPGAEVVPGRSEAGGGSFPGAELPTSLVALSPRSADTLLADLRHHDPPVIARVADGRVLLDVRTVPDADLATLADAVTHALES